jgi:hypothetical protein
MIKIAVILFALAAVAGLTMAIGHFRGRTPPPTPLAALHGALAASGLLALLTAVVQGARGTSAIALCLFLVAALGGFTLLLGFHLRGRKLPNVMVAGHGLLAVSAFVVLLVAVLSGSA